MWAPYNVTWYMAQATTRRARRDVLLLKLAVKMRGVEALLSRGTDATTRRDKGFGLGWRVTVLNVYYDYGYVMRRIFHPPPPPPSVDDNDKRSEQFGAQRGAFNFNGQRKTRISIQQWPGIWRCLFRITGNLRLLSGDNRVGWRRFKE